MFYYLCRETKDNLKETFNCLRLTIIIGRRWATRSHPSYKCCSRAIKRLLGRICRVSEERVVKNRFCSKIFEFLVLKTVFCTKSLNFLSNFIRLSTISGESLPHKPKRDPAEERDSSGKDHTTNEPEVHYLHLKEKHSYSSITLNLPTLDSPTTYWDRIRCRSITKGAGLYFNWINLAFKEFKSLNFLDITVHKPSFEQKLNVFQTNMWFKAWLLT